MENQTEKEPENQNLPEPSAPEEEPRKSRRMGKGGKITLIVIIAVLIVFGISFMPLERWTNGHVKNFNLLSDILPDSLLPDADTVSTEQIDPELLKAENDAKSVASRYDAAGNPLYTDTIIAAAKPARQGNIVVIEDYTDGEVGLYHFKKALAAGRLARMTVVGDSYIEGDIFSQDLRAKLQTAYGGGGVGYVNMHSDFPGFRRSVKQGGDGWTEFAANKKCDHRYIGISEHYFKPKGTALSTYKGVDKLPHLSTWTRSQFLFVAPKSTTVMTKTTGDWVEHQVQGSDKVQAITVDGTTGEFDVKVTDPSLIGLGVWLDDSRGVSLDCMSNRGYSGVTLTQLDPAFCRQMAAFVDYDLIVLEFGINAMSAKQTNYTNYANRLVEIINHVRKCYPGADILLMGIGDRGQKSGGEVHSMKSCEYMVAAQRDAARRAHCLFWDTREAMGGQDAIVAYAKAGKANKDYIHLTHSGGEELATHMFNAMQQMLK